MTRVDVNRLYASSEDACADLLDTAHEAWVAAGGCAGRLSYGFDEDERLFLDLPDGDRLYVDETVVEC